MRTSPFHRRLAALLALAAAAGTLPSFASPAAAVAPDECEQQRARYPKDWNDVSEDRPLYLCRSHYSGVLQVTLGAPDDKGRRLMSLVPFRGDGETRAADKPPFRIWLDAEQAQRLDAGAYFATVVRSEESCWIRGDLSDDTVFLMDGAKPPSDSKDAGAFYNKAPRLSAFAGNAYECERVK
jgi:hypothetical protein